MLHTAERRRQILTATGGTIATAVGLILPLLFLPRLFECDDDCHAFLWVFIAAAFLVFVGAFLLYEAASTRKQTLGSDPRGLTGVALVSAVLFIVVAVDIIFVIRWWDQIERRL